MENKKVVLTYREIITSDCDYLCSFQFDLEFNRFIKGRISRLVTYILMNYLKTEGSETS
jgi:hypothetical protein